MKKLTLIICLTLVSGFAFSQWTKQKPLSTSNDLNSIIFVDSNMGYIVGDGGTILKTSNGGSTWTTMSSGTYANLHSLFFTNIDKGYAVGEYGDENGSYSIIIKTTDGGSSWKEIYSETNVFKGFPLSSIYFTNENTGYAVGIPEKILKTIDGGSTWTSCALDLLIQIFFTDENTGYAYKNYHDDPPNGGSSSVIEKTIDGGKSWNEIWWSGLQYKLHSIYFTNDDTGYAVGYYYDENGMYGIIIKTTDGGKSWNTSWKGGIGSNLSSIYFPDNNTGYAVGYYYDENGNRNSGIIKTSDAGTSWTTLPIGTLNYFSSVFFTDANTGYLVGSGGTILKTTNGGGFPTVVENVSQESDFTVYPNPGTNKINIATHSNLQRETIVCIFNMNGAILQQEKFQSHNLIEMDVSTMAKGIYLLKIQTKSGAETKKLVVQ